MDFLTDNPLINLRGPEFLIAFAIISGGCVLCAYWRSRKADPTHAMRPPPIPETVDPFDVAFLRGGYPDLVRLTILDLVGRGYLQADSKSERIIGAPKPPNQKYLSGTQSVVYEWMKPGRYVAQIMSELLPSIETKNLEVARKNRLEAQQWFTTQDQRLKGFVVTIPFVLLIALLAYWKIIVAFSRGRSNVFILIILTMFAIAAVVSIGRLGRRSALGNAFMERLGVAFSRLRDRAGSLVSTNQHDHVLLVAATFGLGVLEGTGYEFMPRMFKKAASQQESGSGSTSSGCGSSCGSSCGGGSCGGGGCGGCGGGGD
jgi:uncharacterized protein (TIGR04222 family)